MGLPTTVITQALIMSPITMRLVVDGENQLARKPGVDVRGEREDRGISCSQNFMLGGDDFLCPHRLERVSCPLAFCLVTIDIPRESSSGEYAEDMQTSTTNIGIPFVLMLQRGKKRRYVCSAH
jgi:hypothetical protein